MTKLIQPSKKVSMIIQKVVGNNNQIWVSPSDDGWKIQRPGASKASAITVTKSDALIKAKNIARNNHLELIVQNKDGKISQKDTFRKDPFPPRG